MGTTCPTGNIDYRIHGAYSADAMNSVLDHSMTLNLTNYYPYGTTASGSTVGDLKIIAFNGEMVNGTHQLGDFRCIGGLINLHPDWDTSKRMTNNSGCNSASYSSYDEHPGYDYKASTGTPVYAAASGTVLSTTCYIGNTGSGTCADWGAVGIDHGNGYISQYFHMNTTLVSAGATVVQGQQIGTVGGKCGPSCTFGVHLHFEVRHNGPTIGAETKPIVDPYGWVGGGTDPLYSASSVSPANLWQ